MEAKDHAWVDQIPHMADPKAPILKCRNCGAVATNTFPGWKPPTLAEPRQANVSTLECKAA